MLSSNYLWFDTADWYPYGGYLYTAFSGTSASNYGKPDPTTHATAGATGSSSAAAAATVIPYTPAPWHPLSTTYQWFEAVEYYPHAGSAWTTWTGIFASNTVVPATGVAGGATATGFSFAAGTASTKSLLTGVLSGTSTASATASRFTLLSGTTTGMSAAAATATRRVLATASTSGANIATAKPITLVTGALSGTGTTNATALGLLRGLAAATGTSAAAAAPTAVQRVVGTAYNTSSATATAQQTVAATGTLSGTSAAAATGTIGILTYANGHAAGTSTTSATATPVLKEAGAITGTNDLVDTATALWAGYAQAESTCTVVADTQVHYRAFAYTNGNSTATVVAPASQQRGVGRAGNGSTVTATAIKSETATCSTAGQSAMTGIANAIIVLVTGEADGTSAATGDASAYVPGGAIEADGTSTAAADTQCLFVPNAWLVTDANAWAFPNALESVDALAQNYSFATARPAAIVTPATGETDGHSIAIYSTPPALAAGAANGGSDCYGYLSATASFAGHVWCKSALTGTAEVWCSISGGTGGNSQLCGRGATKVVSACAASSAYGVARAA